VQLTLNALLEDEIELYQVSEKWLSYKTFVSTTNIQPTTLSSINLFQTWFFFFALVYIEGNAKKSIYDWVVS